MARRKRKCHSGLMINCVFVRGLYRPKFLSHSMEQFFLFLALHWPWTGEVSPKDQRQHLVQQSSTLQRCHDISPIDAKCLLLVRGHVKWPRSTRGTCTVMQQLVSLVDAGISGASCCQGCQTKFAISWASSNFPICHSRGAFDGTFNYPMSLLRLSLLSS